MGEMIEFAAGGRTARGYLAKPAAGAGNGKGVLVLQEWWGLVPHIKDVADRFAAQGFAALAPDLWDGEVARTSDEASRMFLALDLDRATAQLAGAAAALRTQGGAAGELGVVGFCMGGALALHTACSLAAEIGACVDFYGVHPSIHPDYAKLRAPVLGLFGEHDAFVTPAVARQIQADVQKHGGKMDVHSYDAGHAFFNDARPEAYKAEPAQDAWQKVLGFFATNL